MMKKNNKLEQCEEIENMEFSSKKDDSGEQSAAKCRRIYLREKKPSIYFTGQEATCMYLFMQGMNETLVAQTMNLSPRTINFYSSNMRMKMGCKNRQELIIAVKKTNFLEQFTKLNLEEVEKLIENLL